MTSRRTIIWLVAFFAVLLSATTWSEMTEQETHQVMDHMFQRCEAGLALEQFINSLATMSSNPQEPTSHTTMHECLDKESKAYAKLRDQYVDDHEEIVLTCHSQSEQAARSMVDTFERLSGRGLEQSAFPDLAGYQASFVDVLKCVRSRTNALDNLAEVTVQPK